MIRLFEKTDTGFSSNGIKILRPLSAVVREELNGDYSLEVLIDSGETEALPERILMAETPRGSQPFRIYRIEPTLEGTATVHARHLFYDLLDAYIENIRPSGSAQGALESILRNTAFLAESNLGTTATANYQMMNPVQAIMGADNAFLKLWGGELERDGTTVRMLQRLGADRGVCIRYRKNLTGLNCSIRYDSVVTRIYPTGRKEDGQSLLHLPEGYVDSPMLTHYAHVKTKRLDYPDIKIGEGITEFQALEFLRKAARMEFDAGADQPKLTADVTFIALEDTEEYRDTAVLEHVELGDTVQVLHEGLGIAFNQRVVSYEYDALTKRYTHITLGSLTPILGAAGSTINQQIDEAKKGAEKQISNYDLAVKRLNSVLTNAMGLYSTSVKQEDGSEIYYAHDKPTLAESMVIWKRTIDGFGVSKDGGKTYHAGFTKDGNAVVCVLDAVGVNADWVRTGKILSPNNPYVYFDLDKGIIAASKLVSSEEGATDVSAKIGAVAFSGGGTSQGLALSGSKGLIGLFSQIYPESQTNNRGMEVVALGALRLRSNAASTSDDNALELYNDTSQNGCFELRLSRGTNSDTYAIQFTADKALFIKDFSDDGSQMSGIRIYQDRMEVTTGNGRNGLIIKEGRIGFKTAGSERGSIDANGWHGHFDIPTPSGVTTQVGIMRSDGSARTMQFENGIFTGYV